jgi:hypothetical protein
MLRNGTGIGEFSCCSYDKEGLLIIEHKELTFRGAFHYYPETELHFYERFQVYKDFKYHEIYFHTHVYGSFQKRR